LEVKAGDGPIRIDSWISRNLPILSRAQIQNLMKSGYILVNDKTVSPHRKTTPGMKISITIPEPEPSTLAPENIPLNILYEDHDIIVINKPAGIVVHPAPGHNTGTLVNALLNHCSDLAGIGGELRPGIVHRLDKDTSGVMIVAKNEEAMRKLVSQFKAGNVYKQYLALVHEIPVPSSGTIETLIGRSGHNRKKMSAQPPRGKNSITHYETVKTFQKASMIRVIIKTGRTHQIRVHMSHIGNPVIGDKQYGRRNKLRIADRQMLHAEVLALKHPVNGKKMRFKAPMPEDFKKTIDLIS
jgi:23S rRNA pseudouridine1911/1915/1917 synthase